MLIRQGHFLNYIECINIDYKSVRKEEFLDLQLVVKDCKNIYESFDEYCAEEVLDGDNQYEAEGHGKQDAKKGGKVRIDGPLLVRKLTNALARPALTLSPHYASRSFASSSRSRLCSISSSGGSSLTFIK